MKKNILIILLAATLLFIAGCTSSTANGNQDSNGIQISSFNGGDNALTFSFADGMPPVSVRDNGYQPFSIRVLVNNEGEFDIPAGTAHVALSGFNMADFGVTNRARNLSALRGVKKQGKNTIPGGKAAVIFSNLKYIPSVVSGSVPLSLFVNVCYPYETKSMAKVCIAGDTTVAVDNKQVNCDLNGNKDFANSGGPVSIQNVQQYPYGKNSIQFQFDIVYKPTSSYSGIYEKGSIDSQCNINGSLPSSSAAIFKKDKVSYKVDSGLPGLNCEGTGSSNNTVTLSNDKYTVTCIQDTLGEGESYEKPILITLDYDYFDRISQKVSIEHIQK